MLRILFQSYVILHLSTLCSNVSEAAAKTSHLVLPSLYHVTIATFGSLE